MREQIIEYLKQEEANYTQRFDEEVLEWVDEGWEDDGFENEHDWYRDFGKGEAKDVVIAEIVKDIKEKFNPTKEIDLVDLIEDVYDFLNNA